MKAGLTRAAALSMVLLASVASLPPIPRHVSADPTIIDNLNGTSDAIWSFNTPSDYVFDHTEMVGGNITLERQPTTWWNSTTQADFSGPYSETNIERNKWPGEVTMAAMGGSSTLLSLQPGATGEDSYLDKTLKDTNFGNSQTLIVDATNPDDRIILRFDISAIPANAVIDGAVLEMYQSAGIGGAMTITVYRVISQWAEMEVTWQNRMTGLTWGNNGGDYDSRVIAHIDVDNTAGWRMWNITQLVDQWYRGIAANYGVLIIGSKPGMDSDKTFYSSEYTTAARRPRLGIWYRVLGANAEYISKVGGPGTTSVWKNMSWNPSVKDFLSDEFSGTSLNPNWTWTNPPASYDVGVTTPGSLHAVSTIGTDFSGPTFTGNLLTKRVAGDFMVTMKYSASLLTNGQKSGLIIFANEENWYGISKTMAGASANWMVQATDQAVTTIRVSVPSGNPVPAWLRIQRVGNAFASSTSVNGVAWTLRDTYTPPYQFAPSLRLAFFMSDGLSGTAVTADVDYFRIALGNDATVTVQTRIGDVVPVDASWSGWTAPYPSPSTSVMAGISKYIQYRLNFSVTYPGHMASIGDVNISWFRYAPQGSVETNDLAPSDLGAWGNFTVVQNLNGQTINYSYSTDSGGSWTLVSTPASLNGVSTASGKIRFRANLSTDNTLVSPTVGELRLVYTHRLDHFYVTAPPTAVAGQPFSVSVTAKDSGNNTMVWWTGLVAMAASLLDGVTPGGGVLGTNSIVIVAGGTATINTETYTKAEVIRINATFGTSWGLSDPINVTPGSVSRIAVIPDNVTIMAYDSQVFMAQAYDAYDNVVPGINFTWALLGGIGVINITWGPTVLCTSSPPIANGTLEASFGGVTGTAQIHVVLGPPPWVVISSPASGDSLTGVVPIAYSNSTDSISAQFDYEGGAGWTPIGTTGVLSGTYLWDTAGLNFTSGSLRAIVTNNRTATGWTVITPIEVDNAPPFIALGAVVDNQAGSGTITIPYATDIDVVRVDFSYFDGAWNAIGSDLTIDGTYTWSPVAPINGVTLLAIAVDEVGLTGWDDLQGVGNIIIGPYPPSIAPIPDLHIRVGLTYTLNLTFYISDPDTPLVALAVWDSDAANVTANPGPYPSLDVTYATAGTYNVTLWASDGTDTAWTIIRIISSAMSPPVLLTPLPTVIFDEDTLSTNVFGAPATAFFNDTDGDPMTFVVLDGANIFSQVNGDDSIDMWSLLNWTGSETLRLRAMDPSGGFAEGAFLVMVRPINDPPVLASLFPAVALDEDTSALDVFGGNATTHFFDIEGDLLTITVSGGINVFSTVNSNGTVDIRAAADWYGSEILRVRATDPSGAFAEGTFLVDIRPVNDPPFVTLALPSVTFDEDTTATDVFSGSVATHFSDADGDTFTFIVMGMTQISSRINANLTIDIWAVADWHGTENLRVRATDPNGSWVDAQFIVTVLSINDPPVLVSSFPAIAFDEDTTAMDVFGGDATAHFFDIDGDVLTITVLGGTQVSSLVNPDRTVDMWSAANWSGSENLEVRATDPSGAFAEGLFVVTVAPINDAPVVLSAIPTVTFDEDTSRFDAFGGSPAIYFFDRDGDALTVSVEGATQVLSRVNANLTIDFWAPQDWFGTENVGIRATDPSGEFTEATLLVVVSPINDAPILASILDLMVDDGAMVTLDLTPYISDVDTNISDIAVSTNSQYISVNGRVLTVAFPSGQTETAFTVTISDGLATASRSVKISFNPVWWRGPYMLVPIPVAILLVVGMMAQRTRWKTAKAFLVDDKRRLLREFTLDPNCEITYEQVSQAGALDAVEKPVKLQKYHAQTVKGDAMAVCLLAYGPVSLSQVEFAREMLVNIQDKFDEGVKARLAAAQAATLSIQNANVLLESEKEYLSARSKAFAGAIDSMGATMTRITEQAESVRAKVASFSAWENRLRQQEQTTNRGLREMQTFQKQLENQASEITKAEAALADREKALAEDKSRLLAARQEFDMRWQERSAMIATKEIEVEAGDQANKDRAAALVEQENEIALRLADVASSENNLKQKLQEFEKFQEDLEAKKEEYAKFSKSLEEKAVTLRDVEAKKAEEFRSWQETMESQQAMLKAQRETFDAEIEEQRKSLEDRLRILSQREASFADQETRMQTELSRIDRAKEDLARFQNEVQTAMKTALETQTAAEALKKTYDDRSSELEKRDRTMREEAARLAEELSRRTDAVKVAETEVSEKLALLNQDSSARIQKLNDREAELGKMAKSLDVKTRELTQREAAIVTSQSNLKEWEDRLNKEEVSLNEASKKLETREIDLTQATIRHTDEAGRLQTETEAIRNSLASKEAKLKSDQDRLERDSKALQDRLGIKAQELADLEKKLAEGQASLIRDRQSLEGERAAWVAQRERESEQLEATTNDVTQQIQHSEKLIEEAQRRTNVATELEKASKRQIEEIRAMEAQLEERRVAAEVAERAAEAQQSQLNEAVKRMGTRELKMQAMGNDIQTREEELNAMEEQLAKKDAEMNIRRSAIDEEKARLSALSSNLEMKEKDLEERNESLEYKLGEISGREQALTAEFQRLENATEDLQTKEVDVKSREQFVASVQRDMTKREAILTKIEAEVRRGMEDLERNRKEFDKKVTEAEANKAEAQKVWNEAKMLQERAEKEKAEAVTMQKELQKNVKFLQKKAMEVLEKEEKLRLREQNVSEDEGRLESRDEMLRQKKKELEVERVKVDEKAEKAQSEVAKLKERLSQAEKGAVSTTEMQSWRQDIENRVKIVQKKALDLIDREEKLRKREKELKSLAERLGVPFEEQEVIQE